MGIHSFENIYWVQLSQNTVTGSRHAAINITDNISDMTRAYSGDNWVTSAPKICFTHWYRSHWVGYIDGKLWQIGASSLISAY